MFLLFFSKKTIVDGHSCHHYSNRFLNRLKIKKNNYLRWLKTNVISVVTVNIIINIHKYIYNSSLNRNPKVTESFAVGFQWGVARQYYQTLFRTQFYLYFLEMFVIIGKN